MVTITNSGGSVATNIAIQIMPLTPDFGPREDSELAAAIGIDRNRPVQAGEMLAPHDKPLEKLRPFLDIPAECYTTEHIVIGAVSVAGWVRYRFKGAARYHITPFVRWAGFSATENGEFRVDNNSQGTTVEPD